MRKTAELVSIAALIGALSPLGSSHARELHYDDRRDAALTRCDALAMSHGHAEAVDCYEQLSTHDSILVRADAAAAAGQVRVANRLFREGSRQNDSAELKTRWAHLFLATHQISDAITTFREALMLDPNHVPARLGLARALSENFSGEAVREIDAVLLHDPLHPEALLMKARLLLERQEIEAGQGLLDEAEAEAQSRGWPVQEILAHQAAAAMLAEEPMQPWIDRVLEIDPHYGNVYAIPAHFYIMTYRYREAVDLYRKAVKIAPQQAESHRDLGINLLRINRLFDARHHLSLAYGLDPFDTRTVNSLRLLDSIDGMISSRIEVPDPDRPDEVLGRVIVKLDREQHAALQPYVNALVVDAVQQFSERYAFRLQQPMIVELYHDHDDFGVRTVSTPGIGLLGVTFGYLTAMDSPKARRAGDFHWASTLWHEIAHVFTLEKTDHRLPRWLSEGLSVYEEWNTGPLADRGLPLEVIDAIRDDRLLPIAQFDFGFVRPSYPGQVQVSYMQAGLSCDFIAERFGHGALVRLLDAYRDGLKSTAAFEYAMQISPAEFDSMFAVAIQEQYGELALGLDEYRIEQRQLGEAWDREDWASVAVLARDLVRRYPAYVSRGNAWEALAHAENELGEADAAVETLWQWFKNGGHEPETLRELIRELRARDRHADAAEVMMGLNHVLPYVVEEHEWLGQYWLERGEPEAARLEFDALLGMQPENPAAAWLGRARASLLLGEDERAMREVLRSLESAPYYRPAQQLLLELDGGEES